MSTSFLAALVRLTSANVSSVLQVSRAPIDPTRYGFSIVGAPEKIWKSMNTPIAKSANPVRSEIVKNEKYSTDMVENHLVEIANQEPSKIVYRDPARYWFIAPI